MSIICLDGICEPTSSELNLDLQASNMQLQGLKKIGTQKMIEHCLKGALSDNQEILKEHKNMKLDLEWDQRWMHNNG